MVLCEKKITNRLAFFRIKFVSFQAKLAKGHQDLATPSTTTMSSLRFKGRVLPKKKRLVPAKDAWSVVGYATADSYDLFTLAARLHDQGFDQFDVETQKANVICERAEGMLMIIFLSVQSKHEHNFCNNHFWRFRR